jgi:WD40 repeat protein
MLKRPLALSCLITPILGATLFTAALIPVRRTPAGGASPGVQQPERPRNVVVDQKMVDRTARPWCLAIAPDGGTLAVACTDRLVYLLRPFSGEKRLTLAGVEAGYIRGLAFMPGGKTIAGIGLDKQLRLWDSDSGKLLNSRPALRDRAAAGLPPLRPNALAVSRDGLIAVAGSGTMGQAKSIRSDRDALFEIRVRNAEADENIWTHLEHGGSLHQLAFSPDGKTLAGDTSVDVRLWDARTGTQKQVLKPGTGRIWDVAFSPDNRLVAGFGPGVFVDDKRKGFLTLWELPSGAILHSIDAGEASGAASPGALAFSPDGKSIATAEAAVVRGEISIGGKRAGIGQKMINHVKLWDVATGALKWTSPDGDIGQLTSLVFSPDGLSVYCCDSSAVSRIDARTGQTRKDLMTAAEAVVELLDSE